MAPFSGVYTSAAYGPYAVLTVAFNGQIYGADNELPEPYLGGALLIAFSPLTTPTVGMSDVAFIPDGQDSIFGSDTMGSAVIASSSASVPEPGSVILLVNGDCDGDGIPGTPQAPAWEGHPEAPRTRDGKTAEV